MLLTQCHMQERALLQNGQYACSAQKKSPRESREDLLHSWSFYTSIYTHTIIITIISMVGLDFVGDPIGDK